MDSSESLQTFVLPTAPMLLEPTNTASFSQYKSPTKRITERINGENRPPESPDMKHARNRLGDLLTSIRKGDTPLVPQEKPPVIEDEKRPGPGRPRKGHVHNKNKPGEVIFEMRGKPFSLREDRTSCTEYQLCRAWMRGNLKEEENWTPYKVGNPPDDSIPVHVLAARDIYAFPRATSPYAVEKEWPDRNSLDVFNNSVDFENIDALREEYQRHWKSVKKSFVHHTRLRSKRYHKSNALLSAVYNING